MLADTRARGGGRGAGRPVRGWKTPWRAWRFLALLPALLVGSACSTRKHDAGAGAPGGTGGPAGTAGTAGKAATAGTTGEGRLPAAVVAEEASRLLAEPGVSREALVSMAERCGLSAVSEQGTARGVVLATLAGKLHVRAYRASGAASEESARRAIEWWTVAIGRPELPDVCAPAALRADLAGELAYDPRVTYRELYVARRRLAKAPCAPELDRALDRAAPWRPAPAVLEQLDRVLVGEGLVGVGVLEGAGAAQRARARVVRVSRWTTADSARVVAELDRPATYLLEPATAGTVRVRLEGVDFDAGDARIDASKGLLVGGSLAPIPTAASGGSGAGGAGGDGGTTIVLSLARPAYRRVFFLPEPFRVVIDLSTTPPVPADTGSGPRPLRRVVIDPGHGGADPGAIGPTGLREKDVTLAIARSAAPLIARELGAAVRLTRGSDAYVSLEERAAAGNAFEGDVFVSIHCNAAETRARRGVEMYVLDTARDELAQRVAARENGGGSAAPGELRAILDDLKLAELGARSRHLASLLQKATMASLHSGHSGGHTRDHGAGLPRVATPDYGDVIDGGVHGAGFFVLVGARMPAVLMEASFISNPVEETYLSLADYRARIVDAIVNALRAYRDGT